MREIKFRAWDEKNKKMYFDTVAGITKDGEIFLGQVGYIEGYLMQYTGLKDKNGQEIYEGDIVEAIDGVIGPISYYAIVKCKIEFIRGAFRLISKKYGRKYACEDDNKWADGPPLCSNRFKGNYALEIIGNIHENPELLEEL